MHAPVRSPLSKQRETKTGRTGCVPSLACLSSPGELAALYVTRRSITLSLFYSQGAFGAVLGYDGYVVVRIAFLIVRLCFLSALFSLSFLNPQWVQTSRSHGECVYMREETEWTVKFLDHS